MSVHRSNEEFCKSTKTSAHLNCFLADTWLPTRKTISSIGSRLWFSEIGEHPRCQHYNMLWIKAAKTSCLYHVFSPPSLLSFNINIVPEYEPPITPNGLQFFLRNVRPLFIGFWVIWCKCFGAKLIPTCDNIDEGTCWGWNNFENRASALLGAQKSHWQSQ